MKKMLLSLENNFDSKSYKIPGSPPKNDYEGSRWNFAVGVNFRYVCYISELEKAHLACDWF